MIGLNFEAMEGLQDMIDDKLWQAMSKLDESSLLEELVEQYKSKIIIILQDKGYLIMGPPTEAGDD